MRFLAVLFAILAFAVGMVLGWFLKGCCTRPATTASAVVTVQASPAPTLVGATTAGLSAGSSSSGRCDS